MPCRPARARARRAGWRRPPARCCAGSGRGIGALGTAATVGATPATDATLTEAARLAGGAPVGSHHLLLAALADPNSAAARTLAGLGVDLDQARELLRTADVTGTTDEPPEEAGRRQMSLQVADETLTVVIVDPVLVAAGKAALEAVNASAQPGEDGKPGEAGRGRFRDGERDSRRPPRCRQPRRRMEGTARFAGQDG